MVEGPSSPLAQLQPGAEQQVPPGYMEEQVVALWLCIFPEVWKKHTLKIAIVNTLAGNIQLVLLTSEATLAKSFAESHKS